MSILVVAEHDNQALNGATLNTNALVHEAFLKISEGQDQNIRNRDQFLRVCSVVMRNRESRTTSKMVKAKEEV